MAEDSIINERGELKGLGVLISPEGLIMMPIAIIFDIATFVCAILIIFYGTGYVAGLIVDAISLPIFILWSFIRSRFKKVMEVDVEESPEEEKESSLPQQPETETGEETLKSGKTTQAGEEAAQTEGKAARAGGETAKAAKAGEEAGEVGEETAKAARAGGETAKATKAAPAAAKAARFARWGKIITPIKNALPFLGLIPTWTPTVYFELQS